MKPGRWSWLRESEEEQETEQMDKSDRVKRTAKGKREDEERERERREQQAGRQATDAGRQMQVGTTRWERRTQEDGSRACSDSEESGFSSRNAARQRSKSQRATQV